MLPLNTDHQLHVLVSPYLLVVWHNTDFSPSCLCSKSLAHCQTNPCQHFHLFDCLGSCKCWPLPVIPQFLGLAANANHWPVLHHQIFSHLALGFAYHGWFHQAHPWHYWHCSHETCFARLLHILRAWQLCPRASCCDWAMPCPWPMQKNVNMEVSL